MKKLVILILAALFLVSCERIDQIPDIPEMPDSTEESRGHRNHMGDILNFHSEEELHDYFRGGGTRGESEESSVVIPTHYFKFKNPPPEAVVLNMSIETAVTVRYDTQRTEEEPTLWIKYVHTLQYDIETEGIWRSLAFPDESYIRELDGIKYYIRKGMGRDIPVWAVEWVNADGYNMRAQFPYRFTADEVLGYVSDLERVEIGG
jgi:hypothetical protein